MKTLPARGRVAILGLAIGVTALACYPFGRNRDARYQLLESWGSDVILHGYGEFESEARALSDAASAFCGAPDAAALSATRAAWDAARGAWKRMEVFAFGPYADVQWGRFGPQIDFWPARPDKLEELLAADTPLTPAALDAAGAAVRGLPAIEVALYERGDDTLAAFEADARRCEYLVAATTDLTALAESVRLAWTPMAAEETTTAPRGFLLQLTYPGESVPGVAQLGGAPVAMPNYMGPQASMAEVVNRIGFTIENIRAEKLGAPVGQKTGTALPDSVESRYSGRSLRDLLDVLDGIERVLEGGQNGDAMGLLDYLVGRSPNTLNRSIRDHLAASRHAIVAIPEPLAAAVASAPATVEAAITTLGELQRTIQADVIGTLALSLAFNDADGD
ncbi:MAG: imelysin family protein [Myxococcales bacterium]|nr:imelysin family protein [Myxococcales bacterium]